MKRFTDTEIWNDDWWIELPNAYKFFWYYIKDHCNHAGIVRPQVKKFEFFTGFKIDLKEAERLFNVGKKRVVETASGKWVLTGFIAFQYNKNLSMGSPVHRSVRKLLEEENVSPDVVGVTYIGEHNDF